MSIRKFLHRAIRPTGYDIVGIRQRFMDAFEDQAILLDHSASIIIDAGANIGSITEEYRSCFPHATIFAFEPFEGSFRALSARFKDDKEVKPLQVGLGDREESRSLFVNASSATNSILKIAPHGAYLMGDERFARPIGKVEIGVTTLDGFCVRQGISQIDILKMDIQGAELLALRGAADLLRRKAIRLIYTEVLFAELYQEQAFFCDLWAYLRKCGYELYGVYNLIRGGGGYVSFGDAVFLPVRA